MQLRYDRIIAFDDGFFPPEYKARRGKTLLLGVETKDTTCIIGLAYKWILVDGRETTSTIIELTNLLKPVDLVLLDGITYAGFDVVEPWRIHSETNVPVVVVQQYPLNLERVKRALYKHFKDAEERYKVIEYIASRYKYMDTPWKTIQYYVYPEEKDELIIKALRKTMIYSPIPEPLRITHQIASTITKALHMKGYI